MIRYIDKLSRARLRGTALLRLDFNTEDDWRLRTALPTVEYLLRSADRVVVASHKGRPKKKDLAFSLQKDAARLQKLLGTSAIFIPSLKKARAMLAQNGSHTPRLFVLENLRFDLGEEKNSPAFAKRLAVLADYYVNDAFPVSHRANASVEAITRMLPSYGGIGMRLEIDNLSKVMKKPAHPLVVVLGGAKIGDKLPLFLKFKKSADSFIVGGGIANTLCMLRGLDPQESLVEKELSDKVKVIATYKKLELPEDFRWEGKRILDIGPRTEKRFARIIAEARTIVWNGPMGRIEHARFAKGTRALVRAIGKNKRAFSVTGGGETVMALKRWGLDTTFSFVSTGGGAMLEFLAGKKLPGILALEQAYGCTFR